MSYASPYQGVTVLDLSQGIAGPHCGMLLAAYGARVIKVEPRGGDWMRTLGSRVGEFSAHAIAYNVGKRSIALDLKHDRGRSLVLRIAEQADVMIESFRPGVARRLGVGFDDVKAINPRIIYLSVSGFGQTGPDAERPCTDTVSQAFSGLISINTGRDGIPHRLDTTIIDAITGLYAFQSVSAALHGRQSETEGCHLDISLLQCAAAIQASKIIEYHLEQGAPLALNAPGGCYRTEDGWIAITLLREAEFVRLCEALELPELCVDPRFASFATRSEYNEELTRRIQDRIRNRSTEDWVEHFTRCEVLCKKVNDYGDWLAHPQVRATNSAPKVSVLGSSAVPLPVVPGRGAMQQPPPRIGEHGREILAEVGFTPAEIDALIADGVVHAPAGDGARAGA